MTRQNSLQARGFSMIEVLVAVVILSVGLLAIASLQLSLIRSSGDSKAQSVATGLAKEKLDSMRAFTSYDAYRQLTDSTSTGSCSGTIVNCVGGIAYTLTTKVDRYVFDTTPNPDTFVKQATDTQTEAQLSAASGHTYVVGRDFKTVNVEVKWTDATGTDRKLYLDDVIDGMDPADSAKVAKNTSGSSPRSAEVIISDPSAQAGVIPIAIGDGTDTAATNPRPVVNDSATEVRFDIYTYSALNNSKALAQSRVETNVIGCTCDTATAPTDSTERGYRPTYWNGTRYVAPTLTDYKPDAGQAASKASSESPYCDVCCRDHEDPSSLAASKPRFDPWRHAKGVDHTHYGIVNGALVAVGGSQTQYTEACRLIRVDGVYRVSADPRDDYFDLLATKNDGSTYQYAPTDTATTNYQDFVLAYLDAKIVSNSTPSTYNSRVADSTAATLAGSSSDSTSINYPSTVTIPRTSGSLKYLHSRGLYVDYLEDEALTAIASAKSDCNSSGCTDTEKQAAILSVLPFTSINLTDLAIWSAAGTYITVPNASFLFANEDPNDPNKPLRGKVSPGGTIPSGTQTDTAKVKMLDSTSGLRQWNPPTFQPIDADERDDTYATQRDTQPFEISASGGGVSAANFTVTLPGYDYAATPALSGSNIGSCTGANVGNGGNAVYTYSCSATNAALPITLTANSYNYTAPAATGLVISCTGPQGTLSYTTRPYKKNVYAGDAALVTCKDYTLTAGASNNAGATVSSPTVTNSGKLAETSSVTVSTVSTGNALTLTFTGPTTTYAGYTCTYTTSSAGKPTNPVVTSLSSTCP